MKIKIENPYLNGYVDVDKSLSSAYPHVVHVNLQMSIKRVGKFTDYKKACESAWAFYEDLSGNPYPGECNLQLVSDLLREHLGIQPSEREE